MKASLIAFSRLGLALAQKIAANLPQECRDTADVSAGFGEEKVDLHAFTRQAFAESDLLVFVGAAGIAVRAVAPYIRSKLTDPAVVSVDEGARFCIPLLSGHIGGANRFARRIAEITGAVAVVTTATDVHGLFAVDDWAARRGYFLENPGAAKRVSADLLAGRPVGVCCDFPVEGNLPAGLFWEESRPGLRVTLHTGKGEPDTLRVIPPFAVLGIGCRRQTPAEKIEQAFSSFCRENWLSPHAFSRVCSIDLKQKEAGILSFCSHHGLEFVTYRAPQLSAVQGAFTPSAFVSKVTGVDNVCERAAVLGAGPGGKLLVKKTVFEGVTLAAAVTAQTVCFPLETEKPV